MAGGGVWCMGCVWLQVRGVWCPSLWALLVSM